MEAVIDKIGIEHYPAYKDSGVEWLGQIPEHWETKRLKYLLSEVNLRSTTGNEELLSLSKYSGVIPKSSLDERSGGAESLIGYKLVSTGHLVINKMQAVNGLIAVSKINGITSPDYSIYMAKDSSVLNIDYLGSLIQQPEYLGEFKRRVTGVMDGFIRLYTDDLFDVHAVVPPIEEQTTIIKFLDRKTAQIDKAIAQKEKLIELLKERRQILIHKAVTRGLDPNVKMKDSGVEWIGEVPEHWGVKKITHLFKKIGSGTTPTAGDARYYDGEINFLQTGDLNDGLITQTSKSLKQKALKDFGSLKIYPTNSLVMAMYGATIGKLGILGIESATNQACCVLGEPNLVNSNYMFYVLMAFRQHIISLGYGGGQPNISQDLIKSLRFPIPCDFSEQDKIVKFIKELSEKIDMAISYKEKEIEKLKEYKATLINAAVTGKIKVI